MPAIMDVTTTTTTTTTTDSNEVSNGNSIEEQNTAVSDVSNESQETPATTVVTSDPQISAYFIDKNKIYEQLRPLPDSNLIGLYDLDEISRSVARSNPDGSKGVKLRKSYKNHIADLPGKHVIPKERNLSFIAFQPRENMQPVDIKPLDETYLRKCLNFYKTIGTIPGFEVAKLGMIDDDNMSNSGNKKRNIEDGTNGGMYNKKVKYQ